MPCTLCAPCNKIPPQRAKAEAASIPFFLFALILLLGAAQKHSWSEEASFLTGPAPGPDSAVRLLALADLGQAEIDGSNEPYFAMYPPALNTTRLMLDDLANLAGPELGLVVHTGDISYAIGFQASWDVYFDQVRLSLSVLLLFFSSDSSFWEILAGL